MSDSSTSLPERTERNDLPVARRFRIDAVFVDESTRLKEWLAQRANEELGAFGVDASLQSARVLERAPAIVNEAALIFGSDGERRIIPALLNDARNGTFQTHVPSRSVIWATTILLAFALGAEVLVGILQVVFSDSGAAVVLQAILLALAAMLAGLGVGGLLRSTLSKALPAAWKAIPPELGRVRSVAQLTAGLIAVVGLVVVRCIGLDGEERIVVAALTAFLSALIIAFEAARSYYATKYERLWHRMYDAQVWEADERHRNARPFYESHFRAHVQALVEGKGTIRGTGNLAAAE